MKLHSYNEWDTLKTVIVGTATNANWPKNDPVWALESKKTSWTQTPIPSGPVPQWIIDESNEDLDILCSTLQQSGVQVLRPDDLDFVSLDGMYNYCPRDRFLIAGDTIVDPSMMYPCREMESRAYQYLPLGGSTCKIMPRDQGMIMDAANVCRLGDRWLFLESPSGNLAAAHWLRENFPDIQIEICNFYQGVHIDSTVVPLRDGTVMLNSSRVNENNCPRCFEKWDKIWIDDCVAQPFYQYPYASKWIGLNCLSLDPSTVIIDAAQTEIITKLEKRKFTVIPLTLRHSRTLGGGFHCVTLDIWRQNV